MALASLVLNRNKLTGEETAKPRKRTFLREVCPVHVQGCPANVAALALIIPCLNSAVLCAGPIPKLGNLGELKELDLSLNRLSGAAVSIWVVVFL